ncbi:extracellular solute-binding protein [Gorillibacterium timonense]|uniref:extracellular solute-binding protein n=1 Tax=Gorillibacterium timonense TaxID=1689269 RepID=UPI00071C3920|nr:extracellular solute-binding protein [Gorillibacterium timonense]
MKPFKKVSLGVMAAVLAVGMSACGSGKEGASDSGSTDSASPAASSAPAADGKRVTIEYWHTYSDAEEKVLIEQIKPLFEKQNPGIELKLTRMPYENLKQQVITGVAGDAAPDLMRMDIVWVPEFANMGALLDVSKMDGFAELKPKLFEAPLATTYLKNDSGEGYYGLPVNTNTKVAIYNKSILDLIGKTEVPKTMAELEEYAKLAKEKGKATGGITIGGNYPWANIPYFYSLGGKFTNDDYTKADGYLNSPESVKALETFIRWNKEGLISPPILGGEPSAWDGLKNNDYLMIDDGPWFYSLLMAEQEGGFKPLEQTVRGLIPAGDGGSRSVIGGEDLVIFSSSKHPKEAWTFAKWMLQPEPQKIMATLGLIPANMDAANDPKVMENPFIKEYVEQMKTAVPRTPVPQFGEMDSIIALAFEKAMRGEMEPKAALDDAAKQIDALLAK